MFEYQKNNRFFAQVTGSMEELCEQELLELGATDTETAYRGVYFNADHPTLYKINYTSRLITRILAPLATFKIRDAKQLIPIAAEINWEDFLTLEKTFAITASVANSKIDHSLYAAQCLKDGICDYYRDKTGKRPDVDTENPDVRLNLRIDHNEGILSLDLSGESLHKRGYRLMSAEAPMQETVAAAILRISEWKGEKPLTDVMCGSGTILCEALMLYCNIPAQYLRKKFGFTNMPDFDKNAWIKIKEEEDKKIRPLPEDLISGSDKSFKVLEAAKDNLSRLPYSENVKLVSKPFDQVVSFENGVLITNPPYGIRLSNKDEVKNLYKDLGDMIKQKCKGTTAFVYTGEPSLKKSIGLKISKNYPLSNGSLDGILMQIDSYEGSKKKKYLFPKEEEEN